MRLLLFAAFLVLWGNLLPPLIGASAILPGGSVEFVVAGVVLIVISLAAGRWLGLDAGTLGLGRAGAVRGFAIGALAAGIIAVVDIAALQLGPAIVGRPVTYEPLYRVSGAALARHIGLFLPLGDIIPEEVAFRGALLGGILQRSGTVVAVIGSAAVFAVWHVGIATVTVADTSLGPPSIWFVPGVVGALLILFVGGTIMAALRIATRSIATTVAAHWVFNGVILVGLWTLQTTADLTGA